jgi:hypothetical protein
LNPWVARVRALDDINAVLERGPRVRSTTSIATKGAAAGRAARLVGTVIPTLVLRDGLFSLAGIYLGGECLTGTEGLTSNCPDVGVLRFGAYGGLEHILKDLALVSSRAFLRLTVVGEVGTKAGEEARIEAVHEYLANADGKYLLVDERTRGSKDSSIILVDRGENRIPGGIIVCLPNMVEGSMRLLGVPRAELVEQMIQD